MSEVLGFEKPEEAPAVAGKDFNYLHLLTFPEVIASKIPVINQQGEMFAGPDRKIWKASQANEIFLAWQKAIQFASKDPGAVPEEVMAYFQKTKTLNKAPEEVVKMLALGEVKIEDMRIKDLPEEKGPLEDCKTATTTKILSPPKFSWSFTGLDVFFNICPRKFAARWFYKTEIFEENEASIWGNRKHKADEMALKGQKEVKEKGKIITLEEDLVDWKYVNLFLEAQKGGAQLLVEKEIAINRQLKTVEWFAQDAWGRAKIDVGLIVGDDTLKIFDWKTGKEKYDEWQLRIFCLFAALAYPHLQRFEARYIWLKDDKISDAVILTRAELLPILEDTLSKVARMEEAWTNEIFQCKQNGLCKRYCGVTDCPHHGGKK